LSIEKIVEGRDVTLQTTHPPEIISLNLGVVWLAMFYDSLIREKCLNLTKKVKINLSCRNTVDH